MVNTGGTRKLSIEECELQHMYNMLELTKKNLAMHKEEWNCLSLARQQSKRGIQLQTKIVRLDLQIIKMNQQFEKRLRDTGCIWPIPQSKKDPLTIIGQYMCILMIIVFAGLIFMFSFGS